MSYREENGQVILSMSREDYEQLDVALKIVAVFEARLLSADMEPKAGPLRDRLNEGNPHFTPYQIPPLTFF